MTTEEKALAWAKQWEDRFVTPYPPARLAALVEIFTEREAALKAAIEAHEADKKAFSDAVKHYLDQWRHSTPSREVFTSQFADFILPEPDPLVEALLETFPRANGAEGMAIDLRQALSARGYKIERIEQ